MKAMIDVNQAFEILRHQRTSFAKGSLRAAEDSSGERDSNAGHEPATFRRNFTSASLPTPTPTELDTARRDLVRRASQHTRTGNQYLAWVGQDAQVARVAHTLRCGDLLPGVNGAELAVHKDLAQRAAADDDSTVRPADWRPDVVWRADGDCAVGVDDVTGGGVELERVFGQAVVPRPAPLIN